jgi:hypothetical protein
VKVSPRTIGVEGAVKVKITGVADDGDDVAAVELLIVVERVSLVDGRWMDWTERLLWWEAAASGRDQVCVFRFELEA